MEKTLFALPLLAGLAIGLAFATVPNNAEAGIENLTAGQLVELCIEGRNQSEAGRDSEDLCHMYLKGFQDAYNAGGSGLCMPDGATSVADMSDAIFRWGALNPAQHDIPAADGVRRALACST